MKGEGGQPIWIVITLLLALVVGITMYQLLSKTQATQTFDDWLGEIEIGNAENYLTNFCRTWETNGFVETTIDETNLAKASVSAAALTTKYFTREEFEEGETLSPCDCAVYLWKKGFVSEVQLNQYFDPDRCHTATNDIMEASGMW